MSAAASILVRVVTNSDILKEQEEGHMKRLAIVFVGFIISWVGFAETTTQEWDRYIGLSLPVFGWGLENEDNEIVGYRGIGAGYAVKHYYKPLRIEEANFYWHWGTILYLPYIGVGVEYVFKSGFFVGVMLLYLVPTIEVGFHFSKE